ncbi:MAG: helix-turn-helix domain-containing protein [Hyphomicrobiales bacterium]|nr:helix-turn-helix domain-containing protein [Hyphomicrobiales bacterium]
MAYKMPCAGGIAERLSDITHDESAWTEFVRSGRAKRVNLAEHENIYFEGDRADRIYEVADGAVMLYKLLPDGRRQVVEILSGGGLFGMQAGELYDCSAETLVASTLHAADRREVEAANELQSHITRCLLEQLQVLHDHTVLLGRKSAFERVATFLMRFVPLRGGAGCLGPGADADDRVIVLAMTRQEIADYLGLTIETVSRIFSEMRRRNLVAIERHDRLRICDVCGICRLTGTH